MSFRGIAAECQRNAYALQDDLMQTLVQVVCTRGPSLREAIVKHRRIDKYKLQVTWQKQPGRTHGWAKIHSTEPVSRGAMNVQWDSNTNILLCRVVTKGRNRPNLIIGDFVDYLLGRFKRRIEAINIIPR
jgi:hypothetical protein